MQISVQATPSYPSGNNEPSRAETLELGTPPKSVFSDDSAGDDLQWYAARTYSCRERAVARSLESQGIEYYLPLLTERRRWSDRTKTIHIPLFRNYLFVRVNLALEHFWQVITTRGVTRVLGNDNGPIPVPTEEIEAVARIVEAKTSLETSEGLQAGQRVRITEGPLTGMEGHFLRTKSKERFAIHITLLGQTVLTEIDRKHVEPC